MLLRDLPYLKGAVETMARCNHLTGINFDAVRLPDTWRTLCCLADDQAADISGKAISTFIPDNEINVNHHGPDDDCIDVMADGEEETRKQLVMHANLAELELVLEQFFEGELASLLQ